MADFDQPEWRQKEEIVAGDQKMLEKYFSGHLSDGKLFVAESLDKILGFIFLELRNDFFNNDRVVHVCVLAVDEGATGKGVGSTLMKFAESYAQQNDVGQMTLNVFKANLGAQTLYKKLGYQEEIISMIKKIDLED